MYYAPMPFPVLVLLVISFVFYMIKHRGRKSYGSASLTPRHPMPSEEQANVLAMEKIVAQHEGYTAEVIHINVFGRKRVDDFRLLKPGHEIELRMGRGGIRVYAFGKFMADVLEPAESNLPRLFKETIPFDAYLGGRNRTYEDDYDSCSIIVFYKIDGVPPTKVILK